jgi:NADPH-dependent curcumin reductase CurA
MTEKVNRQVVLSERPRGPIEARHFNIVESTVPTPGPGQILVRSIFSSVAPPHRAWIQGVTYRDQVAVGEVIPGLAISEVISGPADGPARGTLVAAHSGWQEYGLADAAEAQPIPVGDHLARHLGVMGINGLTAYFGMLEVGQVKAGQTVVVSAAAGAVGHLAGQLARIAGARVIGITSSDEKNRLLTDKLGYDKAVNRRSDTFQQDLADAVGEGGADLFYDNTGGYVMEAVLPLMATHGRVVCCGGTAAYDGLEQMPVGPRGIPLLIILKRLHLVGFIVLDFLERFGEAYEKLAGWIDGGQLADLAEVRDGLDAAPQAMVDLLAGDSLGNLAFRIGPDPA